MNLPGQISRSAAQWSDLGGLLWNDMIQGFYLRSKYAYIADRDGKDNLRKVRSKLMP